MTSLLRLLGLDAHSAVESIVQYYWKITHPLPPALLYAILAAGLVLAGLNLLPAVKMRLAVRLWTFAFRLVMVLLFLLVLLQVELHLKVKLQEKQQWTLLLDDSGSMATRDAGGETRFAAARRDAERIREAVNGRVRLDVRTLGGAAPGQEPGRGPTLIQAAIQREALARAGLNRLILLTDGRDTEGRDFTDLGADLKARDVGFGVRLYGSSTAPRDAAIFAEPERPVSRLGEELVVRGSITGADAAAEHAVTLKENGRQVKQATIPADQSRRFLLTYTPPKSGRFTYTVEIPQADSLALNNAYSFQADVVEEKIRVLLIEGFPRYEFKLVKVALEVDPLVELTALCHIPGGGVYIQGRPQHRNPEEGLVGTQSELFKYDVIVLRDVSRQYFREGGDTSESRLRNIVEFVTKRGGGLLVLGGQDVYRAGGYEDSALADVLPFDLSDQLSKEPQFEGLFFVSIPKTAYSHPILRLFADPARNRERLNGLRELDGCNNVGRFKPLATPLMTRLAKVKDSAGKLVEREAPILACQAVGDGKVVAAAVDTFWRWQLQAEFDEPPLQGLLANIIRYTAPPPRSQPGTPQVKLINGAPQVGQEVLLSTTLRDKNYDPVRNADLKVSVKRPDGSIHHIYPRDLPEQPGYYEYRVPVELPGAYEVGAKYGKEVYTAGFVAEPAASEYAELSANREAMALLAKEAGGDLIESVDEWLKQADTTPSTRDAVRYVQVWNSPLALLLFLLAVCLDCYLRKRQGLA